MHVDLLRRMDIQKTGGGARNIFHDATYLEGATCSVTDFEGVSEALFYLNRSYNISTCIEWL